MEFYNITVLYVFRREHENDFFLALPGEHVSISHRFYVSILCKMCVFTLLSG